MKKITSLKFIVILASILLTNIANASPPINPIGLWRLDQFDFITKRKINSYLACFSSDGTIMSGATIANPDWFGSWIKNGDLIQVRMNNIDNKKVDAYFITMISPWTMTGYGQSWEIDINEGGGTSAGYYVTNNWHFINSAPC